MLQLNRRHVLATGGALALDACSLLPDADHEGPRAPHAQALRRPVRVAWVLSSGGPRGFVHVGALKALEELGLQPDLIVGASVGALVGTLRASGMSSAAIETLALDVPPLAIARWAPFAEQRFSGGALADFVRQHCLQEQLERMPVAMACVALRQRDEHVVAFTAGDAGVAVQAAAAMSGLFMPVRIHGEAYGDADGHMPLPVRVARALGAQRVLAIDASAHADNAPAGAQRFRSSDLRKHELTQADARLADLVLHPDFGYWVNLTREFRERAIAAGYRETMAKAAALRALHAA